jgi:hypothetical protein
MCGQEAHKVGGRGKTLGGAAAGGGRWHRLAQQAIDGGVQHLRRQFADARQHVLAVAGNAGGPDFGFQQLLGFLDHQQRVAHRRQFAHLLRRPRIGEAQLQHRRIGEGFLDMHVGRARGDEADAAVAARFQHVERRGIAHRAQGLVALEQGRNPCLGMGRNHDPALRILDEAGRLVRFALTGDDQALDVADARGEAQQHRRFILLGEAEGEPGHLVGFL